MGSGSRHSAGQRRSAKARGRASKRRLPASPSTPPRAFPAQHPYREARASGWVARVMEVLARDSIEERRARYEGLGFDREAFTLVAQGHRSAWSLARRHFWTASDDERQRATKGIYVMLLWRDFLRERPCMEHVDDHLEEGSDALERGDREAAVQHWIVFWDALVQAAPAGACATELDGYLMALRVRDWLDVFVAESDALGDAHPLADAVARVRADAEARLRVVEA